MVKVIAISLFKHEGEEKLPVLVANAQDLSDFSYFTRRTAAEHLRFATRTLVQRTSCGARQCVGLQDIPYLCHVFVRSDGLGGVVVADRDYPQRVAYSLINKSMGDFELKAGAKWKDAEKDVEDENASLAADMQRYQNPTEADKLSKIQKTLDDVKDLMVKNMEEVLKRGESLDALMEKSQDLSAMSVTFYKKARKANSCCRY